MVRKKRKTETEKTDEKIKDKDEQESILNLKIIDECLPILMKLALSENDNLIKISNVLFYQHKKNPSKEINQSIFDRFISLAEKVFTNEKYSKEINSFVESATKHIR